MLIALRNKNNKLAIERCSMKRSGHSCNGINSGKAGLNRTPQGFTIIELVIALSVIAIMIAAAVPAVNGFLRRHAPQHAADELYGDIQLARMRAARNNRQCRIQFNVPAANQYTLQDVDNNGLVIGNFKIGDLTRFRGNISFVASPSAADNAPFATVEFLSQGILDTLEPLPATAPANANSVFITNQANDVFFRVMITAAGGTGVYRWNPNTNQWN
jgi:prepilin-type N-terminal cleavage/methylation domain-containing protein